MKFIRDDIRVRDLDARYKKTMRKLSSWSVAANVGRVSWCMPRNIPIWAAAVQFEKMYLKGA